MVETAPPVGLPIPPHVLDKELQHLVDRRRLVFDEAYEIPAASAQETQPPVDDPGTQRVRELTTLFGETHRARPFGLALSGGGIRSATFNLGILQGLAQHGLLKHVDYLSTVSGGGYIGSWLHGLIRTSCTGDVSKAARFLSPKDNPVPAPPDDDPVSFLRKYSNYLAPRPGLFTADSWVIALIWVRNVLLNQLILAPTVAAGILLLLLGGLAQQAPRDWLWAPLAVWLDVVVAAAAVIALLGAVCIIAGNLRAVVRQSFPALQRPPAATPSPSGHANLLIAPLTFVAGLLIGCSTLAVPASSLEAPLLSSLVAGGVLVLLLLFQLTGGFVDAFEKRHVERPGQAGPRPLAYLHVFWMVLVTATVTIGLLWLVLTLLDLVRTDTGTLGVMAPWITITFAPPLVCVSFLVGVGLLVGLMGADYPDGAREYVARVGSMIALLCAAWVAVFLLAVFGPWALARGLERYTAAGVTAIGGWLATVAAGVIAGRSSRTNGTEPSAKSRIIGFLAYVAPTVFMIGYLVLIATVVHATLPRPEAAHLLSRDRTIAPQTTYDVDVAMPEGHSRVRVDLRPTPPPGWVTAFVGRVAGFEQRYWPALSLKAVGPWTPTWLGALLVGCLVVAAVASSRFNINEFSMHHFYKNRLVRCYLGASNSLKRRPNDLTGFDPTDDFPLADLVPGKNYQGPYAIMSAALNLNAGAELATQERKAASFVFTPAVCGFAPSVTKDEQDIDRGLQREGYRDTEGYSDPAGPQIGMAMAISGAAASPNSGYHTSGPMAFLLTVFDARLGWWLGNPRREHESKYPGPVLAWRYLLAELLGQTTARSNFVNLSDGGHFDNIGLYELVRRRCRYVIVGDGEEDPKLAFESLGGAIRKCRADFGVEIDIDPRPVRLVNGLSTAHCVMGTIIYPENEPKNHPDDHSWQARGYLFYLKASLSGDEPADVIEYHSRFPEFPHQSTANQFFSESQFESYRRLGLHIARDAFEGLNIEEGPQHVQETFVALDRKWYAPIPVTPERASKLADEYAELMASLSEKTKLAPLVHDLLTRADTPAAPALPLDLEIKTAALKVIQLMENVFTEFRFDHEASRANPRNSGWMAVFHQWAKSPILYDQVWPAVKNDYNGLFQKFMEKLHENPGNWQDWDKRPFRP